MPLIPALGRQRQRQVDLYRVNSRTVRAAQRDPVSRKKGRKEDSEQR